MSWSNSAFLDIFLWAKEHFLSEHFSMLSTKLKTAALLRSSNMHQHKTTGQLILLTSPAAEVHLRLWLTELYFTKLIYSCLLLGHMMSVEAVELVFLSQQVANWHNPGSPNSSSGPPHSPSKRVQNSSDNLVNTNIPLCSKQSASSMTNRATISSSYRLFLQQIKLYVRQDIEESWSRTDGQHQRQNQTTSSLVKLLNSCIMLF